MKLRAVLSAAALSVGLVVAPAAAASAAASTAFGAACAEAPTPAMPNRGITGKILNPPDNPPAEVSRENGVTFFEVYGPSGQMFTHQEGCIQGALDSITGGAATATQEATSGQTFANWIMLAPEWGTAATASLASAAFDTASWLTFLDPVWDTIGNALNNAVTDPFAPVIGVVLLIMLGLAIARGRIGAFLGMAGVSLIAASFLVVTPSDLGSATDGIIVNTTTSVRQAVNDTTSDDPGVAMVGNLSDRIIYDSWCAGMLGSSNSVTSSRYCPRLYDATHLTWVEAAQAEQDPDALADIIETKQDEWTDAVTDLQEEDENAYQNVVGENGSNRVAQAINANITWAACLPLLFVSMLLVVAAFFIIRVVASFLQFLALMIVLQAAATVKSGHVKPTILASVAGTIGAAVINSIIFSAIASVTALVNVFIMGTDEIPWPIRLLLCLAFTVVVWIATKPFRKLTRMVSNWDPSQELGKFGDKITNGIKSAVYAGFGSATGAFAGVKFSTGGKSDPEEDDEPTEKREPKLYRQHTPRPDVVPADMYELPAPDRAAIGAATVTNNTTTNNNVVANVDSDVTYNVSSVDVGDITGGPYWAPAATMEPAPTRPALPAGTRGTEEEPMRDDVVIVGGHTPRPDALDEGESVLVFDPEVGLVEYRNGRPVDRLAGD